MTETSQFDNPNDIASMDTLKIQTSSGNISPKIYANGRNQLPIEITAKASDKDNKVLNFSKETWIHILSLCFAESDEKLGWKGNSGWCFTEMKNDYSKEIQMLSSTNPLFSVRDDGTVIIIMYVYTDDINTKRIAVSVDTDNGKHFTTADKVSNTEKMSVTIKAIPAVNYDDKNNIIFELDDFVNISSQLGWTTRFGSGGPYKEHYDGTCKRRIVKIKPNTLTTGQNNFKKYETTYNSIRNNDVNTGKASWGDEDGFNILKENAGYPCAVIGRGVNNDDYQLNLWFSRKNTIDIDGQVYTASPNYTYRFCPYVKENHFDDEKDGFVTLLLYKFTMPANNTYQWQWHDCIRNPNIKVTDYYGNEGTFQLTFDDKQNFDEPGFV